jgi:hypothetical protein
MRGSGVVTAAKAESREEASRLVCNDGAKSAHSAVLDTIRAKAAKAEHKTANLILISIGR